MISALEVDQLSVAYDKTPVLWDISLKIPLGSLVGVIGPNGAGKSTFIKALLGLVKSVHGSVLFFGKSLKNARSKIGYVPQRESVDWDFPITVMELVLMGSYGKLGLFRWPKKIDQEKALHYLQLVGMRNYTERQISELSGGQQQRVFLARALMQEADLYFMDEPFSGIDATSEKEIMQLLQKLKEAGKTILVVHHDLATVPKYFNWLIMLNMRLVACGPTSTVFTEDMLDKTMLRSPQLLDEAGRLAQIKTSGIVN